MANTHKPIVKFTVPGHPIGYYAEGKKPNWTRMNKYRAYKKSVQLCAMATGKWECIVATKKRPLHVRTVAYFANGVHSDPGNVQKGVCDALFYSRGSDKHTGGSFAPPRYDADNPRCEVEIWEAA